MGYLAALLSALFFGMNGSVAKVIMEAGISPAQLTFFRVLTVSIVAGIWLLLTNRSAFRISWQQVLVMAVLGIVGVALLQWTYAVAISLLPVGIALLLEYLAVLAVAVIARVFFKERVKARLWIAIALVLVGLALVAQVGGAGLAPIGVLFGLAAAAALTTYFLMGERLVSATSPMAVAFWSMSFAALFWGLFSEWWTLPAEALTTSNSLGGALEGLSAPVWLLLLWTGVLGSFAPFVLSFVSLRLLRATTAGIVSSAEVVVAFGVAWLWLGESLSAVQLIGTVLVIVAIMLAQTARPGHVVDPDLATQDLARLEFDDTADPPAPVHRVE